MLFFGLVPTFVRRMRAYLIIDLFEIQGAEWTLGGLPAWLLQKPGMEVRTWNETYLKEMSKFVKKVVDVVRPYMARCAFFVSIVL